MTQQQVQQAYLGGGASQVLTRDVQAIVEGWVLAPHLVVQARVTGLRAPFSACEELAAIAIRASAHLARLEQTGAAESNGRGNRAFIGHGHSPLWRELKDFVHDRLGLPTTSSIASQLPASQRQRDSPRWLMPPGSLF
jgi:hypothetical protein